MSTQRLTVNAAIRVARSSYSLEQTLEAALVLADEVERLQQVEKEYRDFVDTLEIGS